MMGRASRYILVCVSFLLTAASLAACGGGSDDVVARVGGSPITKASFDHWLSVQAATNGQTASAQSTPSEALKRQVLDFLIPSQWTLGEAAELGVKVTDGEAQKQLERFK